MSTDEFGNWDPGPLPPDERLFIDNGEPHELALGGYDLSESRYIISFREAAEVLSTYVVTKGMHDLLLFPILFSYRHWLELQLKSIIALGYRWDGERPEPMHTPKLDVLWPRARAAIEKAFPDDPADLNAVESIINQMVDIDPDSMSFRYARNRSGEANLPRDLERVNIGHLATVMLQVGILLDGAASGMDDLIANAPSFEDYI
jgi:hypothetical protein